MSRRGRQRDEDDDDGGDDILTSILFGNINEDGRADVDYLDEARSGPFSTCVNLIVQRASSEVPALVCSTALLHPVS